MEKESEEICQEVAIVPTNLWQIIHRARLKLKDFICLTTRTAESGNHELRDGMGDIEINLSG